MDLYRDTHDLAPLLVTPRDAARLLAVSERTLWSLTADGELPAVRIGRAVRYAVADLRAWIARRRTAGRRSAGRRADGGGDDSASETVAEPDAAGSGTSGRSDTGPALADDKMRRECAAFCAASRPT